MKNRTEQIREWRRQNPEKIHQQYLRRRAKDLNHHKQINRASVDRYYQNNREKCLARMKAWRDRQPKHPRTLMTPEEKKIAAKVSAQKYYYKDHEKTKAWQRQWMRQYRKDNQAYFSMLDKIRRAKRRLAPGKCSLEQWLARCEYFGWKCRYCSCDLDQKTVTMDHMIPISKGGANWPSNLVPACAQCNSKKRARTFKEYWALLMEGL